jgi:Protein of unknown function (DUF4038)/Putative collagen-binding domain of a collagenase
MQRLKVSENKRFLSYEDGTPFFYLGDTAWELFHQLSREEALEYLKNRLERGFNVIQAVALAEFDGLRTPNAYGQYPLLKDYEGNYDPTQPDLTGDYNYWDHVDYIVKEAEKMGMYIGLLPTWGDKFNLKWGKGPEIFTDENAFIYGKWMGERYKHQTNIIWITGGDRPFEKPEHKSIVCAMAKGLKEGDGGNHLLTFHPPGWSSSTHHVKDEDWIDFHMIQTGHSKNIDYYKFVESDYNLTPIKPVFDGEPRYEDHPIDFKPENGYYIDADVRQAAYWDVFAGAFGHTYGHHGIWSMTTQSSEYYPVTWKDAINRPGGSQVQFVKKLIESRPFFDRVPDQSLIVNQQAGYDHLQATRGNDYAFIYTPTGLTLEVNMGKISGESVKASWYNPKDGSSKLIGEFENKGVASFTPPSTGIGNDWVLVLDDANADFPLPGTQK